jgi:hypothetical protein
MRCTCAGTAPGYPQHESFCGQPEPDEDEDEVPMPEEPVEPFIDDWITPCPRCRWLPELHAGPCLPVEGETE